jgi:hypothetical protein
VSGKTASAIFAPANSQSSSDPIGFRSDDLAELTGGEYLVEFAEESIQANKRQGRWEVLCLTPEGQIIAAA